MMRQIRRPTPVPTHTLDHRQDFKPLFDSRSTYLTNKFLVSLKVSFWAQSLLQESQQNRDDDTRLKTFAKANEEDFILVSEWADK